MPWRAGNGGRCAGMPPLTAFCRIPRASSRPKTASGMSPAPRRRTWPCLPKIRRSRRAWPSIMLAALSICVRAFSLCPNTPPLRRRVCMQGYDKFIVRRRSIRPIPLPPPRCSGRSESTPCLPKCGTSWPCAWPLDPNMPAALRFCASTTAFGACSVVTLKLRVSSLRRLPSSPHCNGFRDTGKSP